MEFLNPTTRISSKTSFFSPKFPITRHRINYPQNPNTSLSNFFLYPSFPLKFPRNFRVSAHFGRPTRRKNYLRKKLTQSQYPQQQHEQVSQNPTIHHPTSNFETPVDIIIGSDSEIDLQLNGDDSLVNLGSNETEFGVKEDELDGLGSDEVQVMDVESQFKNELKSLIDQYNADSEFWGVGEEHIFTVYENSDGKVEKVDVDEDEILRRSDLPPSLFTVNDLQEFKGVKSKIAHAKFLAREMENGSNVLGKNSSVAKFVKSGGGLGLVGVIQKFTLDKPVVLSKWSIIGLTGMFGLVLVLGLTRFFTAKKDFKEAYRLFRAKRDKDRYTDKEKEMLRRKMKARMEREKLVQGSVEVIQDFSESEIVFTERPQLDKQDLLNAIGKVTGENGYLRSQLLLDAGSSNSMEFDSKIEEIRRMARHARDSEKGATVQGGIDDKDNGQIVSDISHTKVVIDIKSTSLDNHVADDTKRPLLDKQDLMNSIAGLSLKVPSITPVSESIDVDCETEVMASSVQDIQKLDSSIGGHSEAEKEQTVNGFSNEKQVILKKSASPDDLQVDDTKYVGETLSPRSSKPEDNPVKAKPRIIKSVKEAREYLSKKHEKPEQNQRTEVKTVQEVGTDVNIQSIAGNLGSQQLPDTPGSDPMDFPGKIKDIRGMDRIAREIEETDTLQGSTGDVQRQSASDFSNEKDVTEIKSTSLDDAVADDAERSHLMNTSDDLGSKIPSDIPSKESVSVDGKIKEMTKSGSSAEKIERKDSLAGGISSKEEEHRIVNGFSNEKNVEKLKSKSLDDPQVGNTRTLGETPPSRPNKPGENSVRAKPRIIKSVKEAREYLSQKRDNQKQNQETEVRTVQAVDSNVNSTERVGRNGGATSQHLGKDRPLEYTSTTGAPGDNTLKREKHEKGSSPAKDKRGANVGVTNHENSDGIATDTASGNKENWSEKNLHEFEPLLKKIGDGFQQNYMVAKETVNEDTNISKEMLRPRPDEEDSELEWMKDDRLREIVFKVRENELTGRDPFHLMDDEDKRMFFEGLEKKVEKVNEELVTLHQWVHSNVENLDYGADGISAHDSPEKFVPRWKGPPLDTTPAVLDDYLDQRKALFPEKSSNSNLVKKGEQDLVQKSQESPAASSAVDTGKKKSNSKDLKSSKTVVEGSDGSARAGKKSGKEFWEHTRKWSRGFQEIYNAETDPETKAAMKDIGKDLDRWYTEKEIQDAADLVKKIPKKLPKEGQKLIKEKLEKVKREMELYGPHAVVSKYGEYEEEKEVDYLWWLDLPAVMCIEICTDEDGDKRVGLYTLEMATDLELEPKPYHVIAFEDATDSQNFRYIIQSQMNMIGNGEAFVVAQYPKDVYRDAKASGFSVTVIRKGELKLNVDQTVEEVEELITEIGSKMYHDQITRGRSVNMDSLMKGVFGVSTRRKKSNKRMKKPKK